MINQLNQNDYTPNKFSDAFKELQIGKLMSKSNITKSCGISTYEVFRFLLLLVFQGKNLFRFLNSKHKDQAVSKNTYYCFLNETSNNWSKFLMLLAVKVTTVFDTLTRPENSISTVCGGIAGCEASDLAGYVFDKWVGIRVYIS